MTITGLRSKLGPIPPEAFDGFNPPQTDEEIWKGASPEQRLVLAPPARLLHLFDEFGDCGLVETSVFPDILFALARHEPLERFRRDRA